MKRWLIGVVVVLLLVPLTLVAAIGSAFLGTTALEDGRSYADGRVVTVVDGYVSCYLVALDPGWALVDACQDPQAEAISAALASRGATLADVQAVLLTHGHSDHTGGLAALPGVVIYAGGPELPYLEGQVAYAGPVPRLLGASDSGVRARPVEDGARLTLGHTEVQAFVLPGHTAGSAAYLVERVLLLGDNASMHTDGLHGASRVFSDDVDANVASLRALVGRVGDVDWLVPAHTGPGEGLAPLRAL